MSETTSSTRLRPPSNRYDPKVVGWWRAQLLIAAGVVVVPLAVLGLLITPARFWLLLPAVLATVVGTLAAIALPQWWYRFHRWEVTDHAVYARSGYFWQSWRIAPMTRIQTVDTTRGPVQRLFGLSTVKVTTASAAGAVSLEGLAQAVAEQVAHDLTLVTDATPGDAT